MLSASKRSLLILFSVLIVAYTTTGASHLSAASQRKITEDEEKWRSQLEVKELDIEKDLLSPKQLKNTYNLYYTPDKLNGSYSDLGLALLTAQVQLLPRMATFHRYDNEYEISRARGPDVDQAKCIEQLQELITRADVQQQEKYAGQDINFHQLLDTFGRPPPGIFLMNTMWLGMYKECSRLKIRTRNEGQQLDTRYCVASIRHNRWTDSEFGNMTQWFGYEVGVCLPSSCDSLKYENKFQLVQKLIDFNFREFDKNQSEVNYLYCLPDERSEMRMWWRSIPVCGSLALIIVWLACVISCTILYERLRNSGCKENQVTFVIKSLSIISNYQLLFGRQAQQEIVRARQSKAADLRALDGIKVLGLIYIVIGHTTGLLLKFSSNMREMIEPSVSSGLFETGIQPPSFVVNMFFTITGLLVTYKLFEKNQAGRVASNPLNWIAFILTRYIRIVPVYAATVMYAKYLAIYASEGPLWDYETSAESMRRFCAGESWLWTLLLGANLKPIHEHCILPGWYIANDFQFFLITPIFIYVLYKRPAIGKTLLVVVALVSFLMTSYLVFDVGLPWVDPIFRASPNSATLTMTTFGYIYTWPCFRIPAYLLGIYLGYKLHTFEQKTKQEFRESDEKQVENTTRNNKESDEQVEKAVSFLHNYGTYISFILLALTISVPFQSYNLHLPWDDQLIRIILAQTWPGTHVLMPIALACFILPTATGNRKTLFSTILSAKIWRILSKLNLSLLVVHSEVIWNIYSLRYHTVHITFETHIGLYLVCLLASYMVAFIVYLLVEAPVGLVLNHLLLNIFYSRENKQIKESHELADQEKGRIRT